MQSARMFSSDRGNAERGLDARARERPTSAVQVGELEPQAERVISVFLVSILLAAALGAVVGIGLASTVLHEPTPEAR